ncbi:hypothetical protein OCK74_17100 [Chitinophagaceae bacterium LB-8]|uniref:Circularly permuted type 2 ATP-grasp protein n=1 Tax=Paraflavisolibacter caeni TaxID=2982496 RepID=A0A9X2XXW1_9BACT|nr:hypothetical protein [Paraflavisolibacter caeni]MCU7550840.1 hypothetical protein [Paraflavisolibacter caeni]
MIPELRKIFNEQFSDEKYQSYIQELKNVYPGHMDFRIAETPVFVPKDFTQKMLDTCENIIDVITDPNYIAKSDAAIPKHLKVPAQDARPHFLIFDFAVCHNKTGDLEPQLIEMQGFPSLFAWHALLPEIAHHHFTWPENFSIYLNGFNQESYFELLKKVILDGEDPEHVILLELFPHRQKTKVDFYATRDLLGINIVCITEIIQEGKHLFYIKDEKKIIIKRIYNRVIFDELLQQPKEVQEKGKFFQEEVDVEWVPHPNWFYRISKFSLPFIKHPLVPKTVFLHELNTFPTDLHNYVAKPLFSFAGHGVIIDVTNEALNNIEDKENWILQRKVTYAPIIETPDEKAKVEIRLFYFWEPGTPRPLATNNLARLSKGKMIGVDYNKDKSWVGGSFCLFEQ